MTKKWLSLGKKIGKFFLIIVLVLISIYGILGWYVSTHHDKLLQEVREIANKNCKGEVKIGDLEVLFFSWVSQHNHCYKRSHHQRQFVGTT